MYVPPLPNVAPLVASLKTEPIQVERHGNKVQNARGGWDVGPLSTFTVSPVSCHNTSPRDLLQVPEADRNRELAKFIAWDSQSFPAGVARGFRVADDGFQPDVAIYRGRRFRIVSVRDFVEQGDVWIAIGALVDRQGRP